jgi:HprK-related kinase B
VLHNPALRKVMSQEEHQRFATLPADELWKLEHKYDAFIDQCFGPGRFRLQAPMHALVLLNWRLDNGPLRVERVDLERRRDLMPAFMKSVGLFYTGEDDAGQAHPPQPDETAYLRLLNDCPAYELSGGVDFEAAARACLELG